MPHNDIAVDHERVTVLAYTMITPTAETILPLQEGVEDAEHLIELAGRDCYQSHHRPNPATASTEDYIQHNLLEKHHYSVLEHATVTLRFTGVSRSFTHELVRHRHLSFSQLSQRYVSPEDSMLVIPPLIRDWPDSEEREQMAEILDTAWDTALSAYQDLVSIMTQSDVGVNLKTKQINESARCVMPNGTDTIIVVTGNHRAWREVLTKRLSPQADAEMREVMESVLASLMNIAPSVYGDFVD